jgi:hypothetical protein
VSSKPDHEGGEVDHDPIGPLVAAFRDGRRDTTPAQVTAVSDGGGSGGYSGGHVFGTSF